MLSCVFKKFFFPHDAIEIGFRLLVGLMLVKNTKNNSLLRESNQNGSTKVFSAQALKDYIDRMPPAFGRLSLRKADRCTLLTSQLYTEWANLSSCELEKDFRWVKLYFYRISQVIEVIKCFENLTDLC